MTTDWFEMRGRRTVYEGYSEVRVDTIATPEGDEVEREVVVRDEVVAMVALLDTTRSRDVLLLRQYRHPIGRSLLEIPAGTLDVDGEGIEAAAQRELAEEINHEAGTLSHLVTIDVSPGYSTERSHIYVATELTACDAPDGFEPHAEEADMEVVRLPFADAVDLARRGELTDAKTVIGLLLAAAALDRRDPMEG